MARRQRAIARPTARPGARSGATGGTGEGAGGAGRVPPHRRWPEVALILPMRLGAAAGGVGREVQWAGALGRGGQSIRIAPELDLVVVVTAGYYQDYSPRAFQVHPTF